MDNLPTDSLPAICNGNFLPVTELYFFNVSFYKIIFWKNFAKFPPEDSKRCISCKSCQGTCLTTGFSLLPSCPIRIVFSVGLHSPLLKSSNLTWDNNSNETAVTSPLRGVLIECKPLGQTLEAFRSLSIQVNLSF